MVAQRQRAATRRVSISSAKPHRLDRDCVGGAPGSIVLFVMNAFAVDPVILQPCPYAIHHFFHSADVYVHVGASIKERFKVLLHAAGSPIPGFRWPGERGMKAEPVSALLPLHGFEFVAIKQAML